MNCRFFTFKVDLPSIKERLFRVWHLIYSMSFSIRFQPQDLISHLRYLFTTIYFSCALADLSYLIFICWNKHECKWSKRWQIFVNDYLVPNFKGFVLERNFRNFSNIDPTHCIPSGKFKHLLIFWNFLQ